MNQKIDANETMVILQNAKKDEQSITSDWYPFQDLIEGVQVKEVKNVITKSGGILTEVFRRDWDFGGTHVDQIFHRVIEKGGISGWHMHVFTTDRLFIVSGLIKIVLYDARKGSESFGRINEFCFGPVRPALVIIPPGIWHAVQNLNGGTSSLLNAPDKAYDYEDPDHWRLPIDTQSIPYKF